jgi:hypothetical protein
LAVPGAATQAEVLARHLAGGDELALGPVAHDLHAGLALDDHGGGQVPVAAGGVLVGVGLDALEGAQHLSMVGLFSEPASSCTSAFL